MGVYICINLCDVSLVFGWLKEVDMGKVALITGGSQRIGKGISNALAQNGYDIVVHYNSDKRGAIDVVKNARSHGVQAYEVKANLLNDKETLALISKSRDLVGKPLTLLINNASIFEFDTIETASLTSWDRHFGTNLKAPFFLSQAFLEQAPDPIEDEKHELVAQAQIINMIDQRVVNISPYFSTYTIAKMALWAFTRTAAQEMAPRVRVNAIGPGPTLQAHNQTVESFNKQRKNTVLRRGSNVEDITDCLLFFLNSNSVTGQLVCVDGGQSLEW